jgi:hypothetical protein
MKSDIAKITGLISSKLKVGQKKGGVKSQPACMTAIHTMTAEFQDWFKKIHYEILPMSKKDFSVYCKSNNLNESDYKYLNDNGLIGNCCIAPQCPFFLKKRDRLHHHMAVWESNMPARFHTIVKTNHQLEPVEILKKVFGNDVTSPDKKSVFGRSPDEILQYIYKLKEAYSKF